MEVAQNRKYPVIVEYNNYREYLNDLYIYKKASHRGFSFRRFSQMVGLKSPNYMQRVILGERNLAEATAERVAKVLNLTAKETEYFLALVQMDNASNDKELAKAESRRRISAKKIVCQDIPSSQKRVFSKWHHLLVRELVLFKDFTPCGQWMSGKLGGLVSPEECQESFETLLQAGFIIYENDKYILSEPVLSSGTKQFAHSRMQTVHSQALRFWAKNIESLDNQNQELHLLNIPIAKVKIPELKQRIEQFQDELIGWLQEETDPDRVVQVGTYLFPYPTEELGQV